MPYSITERSLFTYSETRLHNIREEYRSTKTYNTYLDEELALDSGLQPIGDVEYVADDKTEQLREEYRLEAI